MNSITTSRLVLINAMQDIALLVIKRNLSYYHSMIGMFLHTVFYSKDDLYNQCFPENTEIFDNE